MSGKSKAVLWIGLALILLNLSLNWATFKSLIFTSPGSSSSSNSGGGGGNTIIPPNIIPLIPGLGTLV